MNLEAGLIRLKATLSARKALLEKLKEEPDNKIIKDRIKEQTNTINYLKAEIKFDEIFEAVSEDADDDSCKDNCKNECEKRIKEMQTRINELEVKAAFVEIEAETRDAIIKQKDNDIEVLKTSLNKANAALLEAEKPKTAKKLRKKKAVKKEVE